jgi:hypothetical protein
MGKKARMPALKGMRLVTVSESGEDVPLDEAVIKDVTGNEAITALLATGSSRVTEDLNNEMPTAAPPS